MAAPTCASAKASSFMLSEKNVSASLESEFWGAPHAVWFPNFRQGRIERGSSLNLRCASTTKDAEVKEGLKNKGGQSYFNVTGFPFPLRPFFERTTIRYEIERGRIWTFEQEQGLGFSSVTTNIRMTVIRLKSGGLWVHSPIAPTNECIELLKDIGLPVEHIVLPTFAYEHKIFVGPFSRKFPSAKVWTAPSQWSWPINLPPQFFGIFPSGTLIEEAASSIPWVDEIEFKVLKSPEVGIGPYVEVAFFHKPSKTLLVTDAVIRVPTTPLDIVRKEALLQAAENGLAVKVLSKGKEVPNEVVVDNEYYRQRGWQRMVLQILYFGPSNLLDPEKSFNEISNRLIVSPVVKTLVFDKVPEQVKEWVDAITSDWNFKKIIPAHFSAPINASPKDFKSAFSFLDDLIPGQPKQNLIPSFPFLPFSSPQPKTSFSSDDMKTLSALDGLLVSLGAVKKTVSSKDS